MKPILPLFLLVLMFFLAGCGSQAPLDSTQVPLGNVSYYEVHTPDGTVPCLVYSSGYQGGLDCDWTVIR